jgi:hypothetical protein
VQPLTAESSAAGSQQRRARMCHRFIVSSDKTSQEASPVGVSFVAEDCVPSLQGVSDCA